MSCIYLSSVYFHIIIICGFVCCFCSISWNRCKYSSFLTLFLQGKVPLLSLESLHHLHTFIFVLAVVHVTLSVLTVVFGGAKVRLNCLIFYVYTVFPFYFIANDKFLI